MIVRSLNSAWFLFLCLAIFAGRLHAECKDTESFTLMIHGGAGAGSKPESVQNEMLEAMKEALKQGYDLLNRGFKGEEVVVEVISMLEDSPLFNAGRGGNPNKKGFVELDASIMRGSDKNSGAVAAVKRVKNPIKAALTVMNKSRHVMFAGPGADDFAEKHGLDLVPNEYFHSRYSPPPEQRETGTVGAVVVDRCGDWVAGTSTGGFGTKTPGRIGDSPIIGAGTYAENKTCAVSCTGHGEFFIRYAVSHSICALIKHKKSSGIDAAKTVLERELLPAGGKGGAIVIDDTGKGGYFFTTRGMLWGKVTEKGDINIGI